MTSFSRETFNYYIRINDSSKPATHSQIRDMFEISNLRTARVENFLKTRNIFDPDDMDFCMNHNSGQLVNKDSFSGGIPILLFNIIPKNNLESSLLGSLKELKNYLKKHASGYQPSPEHFIYNLFHNEKYTLDSIVYSKGEKNKLTSYFEVAQNGFIEAGFSNQIFYKDSEFMWLDRSFIIGYQIKLINFAKEIFRSFNYYEEVLLQLSLKNILYFKIEIGNSGYSRRYDIDAKWHNTQLKNAKIIYPFSQLTSEEEISNILSNQSDHLCKLFGFDAENLASDLINESNFNHFLYQVT